MHDQGDALTHSEFLQQGVEVAAVFDEAVRLGSAVRQLVGVTHADQIRCDAASEGLEVGQHVALQVGGRGISVQQDNRIALANFDVGQAVAKYA
jgi:hypothetical protein